MTTMGVTPKAVGADDFALRAPAPVIDVVGSTTTEQSQLGRLATFRLLVWPNLQSGSYPTLIQRQQPFEQAALPVIASSRLAGDTKPRRISDFRGDRRRHTEVSSVCVIAHDACSIYRQSLLEMSGMSAQVVDSLDAARLIDAAHDLGPTIFALRGDIERERQLPRSLVETLRSRGFFSLWLAKDFGGPELSLPDFVRVVEAVARYDGSVGWCVSVAATYSLFSGFLPEAVARRIFVEDRSAVAGNLVPLGRAEVVEGGYRVSGRWPYGSGITHSEWVLGNCVVHDGDAPRQGTDGTFETTVAFFPAREAEVIDTWDVGGLRGTGSHDYQVADVFVQDSHVSTGRTPLHPSSLYAMPFFTAAPPTIAAVLLGIARAALDALIELSRSKTPLLGSKLLREKPVVQAAIGRSEAMLCAARSFVFEACEDAWKAVIGGAELTLEQRTRVRLSCAHATDVAKSVVQICYEIGGGTAVYESSPLQRCFRDAHTAAQHVQVQSGNFETVGRVLLGLEPGTWIF